MDLVILAGSVGRGAAWTRGGIKSLLPLPAKSTLIEALIQRFDAAAIQKCIICSGGNKHLLLKHVGTLRPAHLTIDFFEDAIPLGTAGCLKACELETSSDTILLTGGSVWLDDDPQWMLEQHRKQGNALTVFCTREPGWASIGSEQHLRPAGVFCCDRSVFRHIRPGGFQDLKEQLVPALQRAGLRVGVVPFRGGSCEVSDPATYLKILAGILSNGRFPQDGFDRLASDIWCGRNIHIASRARIVGPVLLGHNCRIEDGAVIVGPTMLGNGTRVERNARLIRVVTPNRVRIRPGLCLTDRILTAPAPPPARPAPAARPAPSGLPSSLWDKVTVWPRKLATATTTVAALLFASFVWAFWASISNLWYFLVSNTDYSAGQLVPVAALYMAMSNKKRPSPTFAFWWPGLAFFGVGVIANIFGYLFRYVYVENFGLIACALGIVASVFGRSICTRIWYPLLFLFLMVPLPTRVHYALMQPLQSWGAQVAVTALESMGIPASRTGCVIHVSGHQIAVAEACSGLRMVLAFLIVTSVIAYAIQRPVWQKLIVFLSSIPIALACNVFRLVVSAYLISIGRQELAQGAFHDGAGLVMMPVAIGLVFLEFWLLSNLVVPGRSVSAIVNVVDERMQRSGSLSGG